MNKIIKGIKLILNGLLSPFTAVINGIKELMYVGSRVQHIEDNLMYDTTPEVLSSKLIDVEHSVKNRMDGLAEINKSMREKIDSNKKRIDNVFGTLNALHDSSINELNKKLSNRINEVELSLESISNKDKPKLTFYPCDEPTQVELNIIESEAKGESVAREEYDYTSEKKSLAKKVQKMMKLDEDEFIND